MIKKLFGAFSVLFGVMLLLFAFAGCDFSKKYTVTFEAGEFCSPVEPQTLKHGEIPTLPTDPAMKGYAFVGWYTDAEYKNKYDFGEALNADTTLYACVLEGYEAISTVEDLNVLKLIPGGSYLVVNDIDLGGKEWEPVENFSGTLNGNGHKIFNFVIAAKDNICGFIGENSGLVENMIFDDVTLKYEYDCSEGLDTAAGVIAAKNSGTIKNCELLGGNIEMSVSLYNADKARYAMFGSLVGQNSGTVTECISKANISFESMVGNATYLYLRFGGAVGTNAGTVEKTNVCGTYTCKSKITSSVSKRYAKADVFFGGVVGMNEKSTSVVRECASSVDMKMDYISSGADSYIEKGLDFSAVVARNQGIVENCLATGTINYNCDGKDAYACIGGIVGCYGASGNIITNVFSDVDITTNSGDNVSGIVGHANGTKLTASVYIGNITINTSSTVNGFISDFAEGSNTISYCYYANECVLTIDGVETEIKTSNGTATDIATIKSETFIKEVLGWNPNIWEIVDGENPKLK